jgi:Ni,Fe-hydrogenase III component G
MYSDEVRITVNPAIFKDTCFALHKILPSPVMMLFAVDERAKKNKFEIICVFTYFKRAQWIAVTADIPAEDPSFDSLAKSVHSASLFEREIR